MQCILSRTLKPSEEDKHMRITWTFFLLWEKHLVRLFTALSFIWIYRCWCDFYSLASAIEAVAAGVITSEERRCKTNSWGPGSSAGGFLAVLQIKGSLRASWLCIENATMQGCHLKPLLFAEADASLSALRRWAEEKNDISARWGRRAISFFLRVTHRKDMGS